MADKCPKCGAEQARIQILLDNQQCQFKCGTEILADGEVYESKECLRNQLAQRDAEIERLREELRAGLEVISRWVPEDSQDLVKQLTLTDKIRILGKYFDDGC